MHKLFNNRDTVDQSEDGFTLIELMVVVLIIGILMAIAIPTFLSAKNGANAKAAQENVRNALTTEAAQYSSNQTFTNSQATLTAAEPNITFGQLPVSGTAFTPSAANVVYEGVGQGNTAGDTVVLGALGKDNNCYFVASIAGQNYYAQQASSGGKCVVPTLTSASNTAIAAVAGPPAVAAVNWTSSWNSTAAVSLPTLTTTPEVLASAA